MNKTKTTWLQVRLTPQEREWLKQKAKKAEMTVSEYIRAKAGL